jgi:hypothetical protein
MSFIEIKAIKVVGRFKFDSTKLFATDCSTRCSHSKNRLHCQKDKCLTGINYQLARIANFVSKQVNQFCDGDHTAREQTFNRSVFIY